jgi:Flp pilus assembly protein TadG
VDTRSPSKRMASRRFRRAQRGSMTAQFLVVLVPVFFGMLGFAIDLGQLYLIRGELKTAANAMAMASAAKLIGTAESTNDAIVAAQLSVSPQNGGAANKYNFGSITIGETSGFLTSAIADPGFYATTVDAIGESATASGATVTGSTAKDVRITILADAPLTFWSFLSLGQAKKTSVGAKAVAGMSAPLCTACGTVLPYAIQAVDATDSTDFGLVPATRYTFGFMCRGTPPGLLSGTTARLTYLILNRYDTNATLYPDESSQLYRIGAGGLPPNIAGPTLACLQVNAAELIWANAAPMACTANTVPSDVSNLLCGLTARFDPTTIPTACSNVVQADVIASAFSADTDLTDLDDYTAYVGNQRRILTVAVVDTLDPVNPMNVLGFRQFLLEPNQNTTNVDPTDLNARFVALYIGSVVPVQQGRFSGCTQTAGPGKVVLHQ